MSGFAPVLRKRETVRGLILTPDAELLLIHLVLPDRDLWITPGGGIAAGESQEDALRRELIEEVGRGDFEVGPKVWVRSGRYRWAGQWIDEREHFYLIRSDRFLPDTSGNPIPHEREAMAELRWWRIAQLPAESKQFAPMRMGSLVMALLDHGIPPEPIETGF